MRYYKRLQVFKSQRCVFDPHTMQAWSYDWWQFVQCRNGRIYFNGASYSMQTRKQQGIVRDILQSLGVKYRTVYVRSGLQAIDREIESLHFEIEALNEAIAKPRSRKGANKDRLKRINYINTIIVRLKKFDAMKVTDFKGRLDFSNLPKPKPLTDYQKASRAEAKAAGARRE